MKNNLLIALMIPFLIACHDGNDDIVLSDDFPRISVSTENASPIVSKEDYLKASVEVKGKTFEAFMADARIRGRGNSTWAQEKKPYQIKFDDKASVLGMAKDKKWILLTNHSDKSMLRTEVAFELGRMSTLDYTPDSRFAELFVNQHYYGLYQVTQKVEASSHRVNIGDDGFLLEVDQPDRLDPDDVFFRTGLFLFNIKDPDLEYGDEKYLYIENHIQAFEKVLMGPDFLDTDKGYREYIDVDSFVDWYLINELAKNQDSAFYSSVYMNIIPGGQLKMGPIWDFDIGFGNNKNPDSRVFDPEGFWVKRSAWMTRLFEDPFFVSRVKERFHYFYGQRESIYENIQENANYIDAAQTRNYVKWETLGKYVWPNPVYFDTYSEEVEHFKDWLDKRFEWMKNAINAL